MSVQPSMKRARACLLGMLLLAAPLPGRAHAQQPTLEAVADSVARALLHAPVAAVSMLVAQGDSVLLKRAWGASDVDAGRSARSGDVYQIGSITKQFTAAAIMQLVESGRIRLDAPLQTYLPDFDTHGQRITVEQLLNHTSGIPSYTSIFPLRRDVGHAALLDTIQKLPLTFPPGTESRYNNSGYLLLGHIIERVTGTSYADHLQRRIFDPLGLTATRFCGHENQPIPEGYAASAGTLTQAGISSMNMAYAAGGLCSTVGDLFRWQRALQAGRVISAASYERMTTPTRLHSGQEIPYGYGLSLGALDGHTSVSHGGGLAGYSTQLAYYPEDSLTVVVLVNTVPGSPERVAEALARVALSLGPAAVTPVPLPADHVKYAGDFRLGARGLLRVRPANAGIEAAVGDAAAVLLVYEGDDNFSSRDGNVRIMFNIVGGKAVELMYFEGFASSIGTPVK